MKSESYSKIVSLANSNLEASYYGESDFSGHYRSEIHSKSILRKEEEDAFANHLNIFHPKQTGAADCLKVFNIKVL